MSELNAINAGTMHSPRDRALGRLRETVDQVLGSVFYGPLLRGVRSSSLKGSVGHGGRGEDIFQAQLDQIFAERAGQAGSGGLGDTLYDRFARAAAAHAEANNHVTF